MIEIRLDRVRHLRIDTEEIIAAEKLLEMSVFEIGANLSSLRVIRALLWVGLLHEDAALKIEDLNPWLRGTRIAYAIQKIDEALKPWIQQEDSPSPFPVSPGADSAPSPG